MLEIKQLLVFSTLKKPDLHVEQLWLLIVPLELHVLQELKQEINHIINTLYEEVAHVAMSMDKYRVPIHGIDNPEMENPVNMFKRQLKLE